MLFQKININFAPQSAFMKHREDPLETLGQIRSMMERSSRFISLSGLSGVVAGLFALGGSAMIYLYLGMMPFTYKRPYYVQAKEVGKWGIDYMTFFYLVGAVVLFGAVSFGVFFTIRKALKKGLPIWDNTTKRLLVNLAIPLFIGGLFCLGMIYHGLVGLIAPSTLIFYGLALINAGKYTFNDIIYLGLIETLIGLIALFNIGFGLEFWAIGFGFMHIFYGIAMYFKYEKK